MTATRTIKEFRELDDVTSSVPADGDVVVWNTGAARFEFTTLATQVELDAAVATVPVLAPATSARNVVQATADVVPFTFKKLVGQTADLTQWQDDTGAVKAKMIASGFELKLAEGGALTDSSYVYFDGRARVGWTGGSVQNVELGDGGTGKVVRLVSAHPTLLALIAGSAAAQVPLAVRGFAAQTADLQQWQDSAVTRKAAIGAAGHLILSPVSGAASGNPDALGDKIVLYGTGGQQFGFGIQSSRIVATLGGAPGASAFAVRPASGAGDASSGTDRIVLWSDGGIEQFLGVATRVGQITRGAASQSADLTQWQDSAAAVLAKVSSSGAITSEDRFKSTLIHDRNATRPYINLELGTDKIGGVSRSAAQIPWVVQGAAGQTGDLQQWRDSALAVLAKVTSVGKLGLGGNPLMWGVGNDLLVSSAVLNMEYGVFCRSTAASLRQHGMDNADGLGLRFYVGTVSKALISSTAFQISGELDHDGAKVGFFGIAPAVRPAAYTPTNVVADRTYDANATTLDELSDVVGTLIADLQTLGLVA